MNAAIRQAISDSIREDRTVEADYDGDISDCIADIGEVFDGDVDYAQENDGSYDVWGWTEETPDGKQDWRLTVRVAK